MKKKSTLIFISLFALSLCVYSNPKNASEKVIQTLQGKINYTNANQSFSPHYSDIGLGFNPKQPGISYLYLHYNRRTVKMGMPFIKTYGNLENTKNSVVSVNRTYKNGNIEYAFYDHNSWIISAKNIKKLGFNTANDTMIFQPRMEINHKNDIRFFECYMPTLDSRDPDKKFPVIIGFKVIKGTVTKGEGIDKEMQFLADSKGNLLVALTVKMLSVNKKPLISKLNNAPENIEEAKKETAQWFDKCVGNLNFTAKNKHERKILSRALYTLAFNSSKAPGKLGGRISQFPSRGDYPTHFLWDACFHNLALEHMDPLLAEDALLLLLENLREDGKMAHFLCSTWMRPHETQPPLVGWAAWRLIQKRNSPALARKILDPLVKNTYWWLDQRMSKYGLIYTPHALETGWDNSPRFDKGPAVSTDMNTYLLLQMRACENIAKMLGRDKLASKMEIKADQFAKKIKKVLYDPKENIFKDVNLKTGKFVEIKTPASFIPLLAEIPLNKQAKHKMIKNYMLNKDIFFDKIPFPSVGYNEEKYNAKDWWRGPTWLSPSWLMLEILKKYKYDKEYNIAAKRLYEMVIEDGRISELFNSQTGKGKGNSQQGWTAAILLKLNLILNKDQ